MAYGLMERFNRTLVSRYVSSKDSGVQSDLALQQVLPVLSYRNTPHSTTGRSPALMFLNRRLPTLLDRLKPDIREKMEWEIWKQKSYHNLKAKTRLFEEGEEVRVKNERTEGWSPGLVERKTGELSYEVSVGGDLKKKHANHLRRREGALEVEHQPETPKGDV